MQKGKTKSAYIREIDEAVASAESGTGHSFEQITKWMESWGTKDELSSPEPDIVQKLCEDDRGFGLADQIILPK